MSVRRTDRPSWKIHVCSRNKWTLLEKFKKVAPGKKEQIFSKTVSVAASEIHLIVINYLTYECNPLNDKKNSAAPISATFSMRICLFRIQEKLLWESIAYPV